MDISGNEAKQAEILHQLIELVMRQTQYDYDMAHEKLRENEWDYMKVIRLEMGIKKEKPVPVTLNQEIFRQIRAKMDEAGNDIY